MKKIILGTLFVFILVFCAACHRPSNIYGENATTRSQEEIEAESRAILEEEELMNNPPCFSITAEVLSTVLKNNNYEVNYTDNSYKLNSETGYFSITFNENKNGLANIVISINETKPLLNNELRTELFKVFEIIFKAIDNNEYNSIFLEDMLMQISEFEEGQGNTYIYKNNISVVGAILFEKIELHIMPQKVE